MKRLILLFLLPIFANSQVNYMKDIPIIDREIFFDTPEIAGGQLSPKGNYISFMKEYNGITNLWVKKFDEPFDKAKPLTNNERPLGGYFWTEDEKYILYVKDNKGDENYNLYAVNPVGKVADGGVPESKNLTPMDEVTVQIMHVSKKNPDELWVGINDRDKAWHDLYKMNISTGKLEKLFENKDRITGFDFDWDEKLRLAYRTAEDGTSEIMTVDENYNFKTIYTNNIDEQAYVTSWNKENSKAYLVSNKGDVNFTTLYLMDPKTGKTEKVESDKKNKVDFGGLFQDENTREVIATYYVYDKTEYNWQNKEWKANYEYLQSKFPGREVGFSSSTTAYDKFLISVSGDDFVSETYYFNPKSKELIFQYTPRPKLKELEKFLAKMEPISYKSSDGLEIPGYLTIPKGAAKKNLPLVVMPHGGPKGPRDYWGYNAYAQILANRGYAVMFPNFRASGGYGKAFLNAGDKEWGKKMQDDITWGVQHLIDQGIVDKNRVAIMGGSYGGYATLAGLVFTPDLYTCGVDIVGPSNLFTLLESVPAYWESFRTRLYAMTGDPNTEEGQALIKAASPLFHVEKINKPLLIIQGANDPRVKQAESDQIVVALRDSGKEVEYILADDEGHGFHKPVNNMAMWASIEKFLAEHLGGRYQESMTPEVEKRLGEITQDISKVTYTPAANVEVPKTLPTLENNLKEATYQYDVSIEVQGQSIPMQMTRTVKKDGEHWIISDVANSPMGEMKDEVHLKNMTTVKRVVNQAGQEMIFNFEGSKITANIMGNNLEIPYDKAMMNDGAGLDMLIARWPLKEGYKISFLMPDMMTQKMKTMNLSVEGKENNLWKVKVVNNDNPQEILNFYIDENKQMAVKSDQIIPAMGNAKMTVTLK